jgi:hypothetical protein
MDCYYVLLYTCDWHGLQAGKFAVLKIREQRKESLLYF